MKTTPFRTTVLNHRGHEIRADWYADDDGAMGAPWEEHDGHGPVRIGREDSKAPGERVLAPGYFYDWQGANTLAKADGWGLSPEDTAALASRLKRTPTAGEVRAEAVRRDFEYCRGWLQEKWCWCGFQTTITGPDGYKVDYEDGACWGIESFDDCLRQFEEGEIFPGAREVIDAHLAAAARERVEAHRAAARERVEAHRAACCDIATV